MTIEKIDKDAKKVTVTFDTVEMIHIQNALGKYCDEERPDLESFLWQFSIALDLAKYGSVSRIVIRENAKAMGIIENDSNEV